MEPASADPATPAPDLSWLDKGGETGALIRTRDWSASGLGGPAEWPQSLRTATAILLLSPVPIVLLWGPKGIMIYNDAYSGFAGGRHPGLLGSEVRKGWSEIADFNDNVMRVGLAGGTLAYRDQALTLVRKGRPEPVWMDLDYSPVLDESGQPGGVISIVVETTERVRAEAALRASERRFREALEAKVEERTAALVKAEQALMQSQKMEALGSLTGGIAHDFNNLLMAVQGSMELLRERVPDPSLQRYIDNALTGVERGSSLTRRMLAFARKQDLKSDRVEIRPLIEGMTELMQRSLGSTIIIETTLAPHLPAVEADTNQLEAALLNLAVNARDAMDGVGTLRVSTREAILPTRKGPLVPGHYVVLSIADSGAGMDDDTLKRAAEPFFTTKAVGKGTGLGLSMVHGLAEQLGGALLITSRVDVGTTAEIWLPAVTDVVRRAGTSAPGPARPGTPVGPDGSLTVLNVDDDDLVRMTSREMLEDLGYNVLPAASAAEALALLEQHRVDLVLTDHAMPRMTGMQLAVRLRELYPQLPVVIATGYSELVEDAHIDLPRLAKPYAQAALADVLANALANVPAKAGTTRST